MFEHSWNSKQVNEATHKMENGNYVHNDGL